jgi:hypothetical protein
MLGAMKITRTANLAVRPDDIFDLVATEEFQDAKCEATEAISHGVSVTDDGGRTVITVHRELPSHGLPDVAQSFVGSTITVIETQDWGPAAADGSRSGRLELRVHAAPMSMHGSLVLRADGHTTVWSVDADLKAAVPLLGGRLEKAAAPPIIAAIDIEMELAKERLGA